MQVREGMSDVVLSVGPSHTIREAATAMSSRKVGAAVVNDPDGQAPGVITERDILNCIGAGEDPDTALVADHHTSDVTYAAPEWSLEEAAATMVRGSFRHLIVIEHGEVVGILAMRDIVRVWTGDGANCDAPAPASA